MWKVDSAYPDISKTLRNFKSIEKVDLDKSCEDLKEKDHFKRSFPQIKRAKAMPNKFIYNDYHTKNTGPGYGRNDDGKPFSK